MRVTPRCEIDHIIVTAPSLEVGGAYVFERLGVHPQKGGEHARMGTHNLLLSLGKSAYLEVIAINPAAPKPATPRWFGLDDLPANAAARLYTWAARSTNLAATVQASAEPMRPIVPMSRGVLNWLITSPDTSLNGGDATHGGLTPTLIEWQTDAHPASTLPDAGLVLMQLDFFTFDVPRIQRQMAALGLDAGWSASALKTGEPASLRAQIQTSRGMRVLG
jgi:Glyoxalase-like domain